MNTIKQKKTKSANMTGYGLYYGTVPKNCLPKLLSALYKCVYNFNFQLKFSAVNTIVKLGDSFYKDSLLDGISVPRFLKIFHSWRLSESKTFKMQ